MQTNIGTNVFTYFFSAIPAPLREILLIAVTLCIASSPASAQLTAKQLLDPYITDSGPQYVDVEKALTAFRTGDAESCRRLLHEAKKKNPQLAPAEVMQARLYLSAGRTAEAEDAIELAVAQDRDDPEALLILAELAFQQRRFTYAELSLERAAKLIEAYTRNPQRLNHLRLRLAAGQASVAEVRGLWADAEKQIAAWIQLDPKNASPHARLARVQFEQKKYKEARAAFAKQAELDKSTLPADLLIGQLCAAAGMADYARQNMEAAVKAQPNDLRTRLAVADWALSAGLNDLAKENADAARKLDATSVLALVLAGRAARQRGDLKEAESLLQTAVIESPANFAAANHLALTLSASDDKEKKRRAYEYAQLNFRSYSDQNTPAGREAAVTYAWLLFQSGREAEAEQLLQAALRAGSISNESAYFAASIFSRRGNEKLAVQILGPVLGLDLAFPSREDAKRLLETLNAAKEKRN
jgi:tetratricopeptide (TPR) repeat protein